MNKKQDRFSPEEAQQRFEAALRGARITGHKPMKDKPKKKSLSKSKPKKKQNTKA
jgi:hypothetical protein